MDHLTLPSVSSDTTLEQALKLLNTERLSGLVADMGPQPAVLDLADILAAWRQSGGGTKIADVAPRRRTVRLPTEEPAQELLSRSGAWQTTEAVLDREDAGYAVTRIRGRSSDVVTRHEGDAEALRTTRQVYRCRKNAQHVWSEDELASGHTCILDGAPCNPL